MKRKTYTRKLLLALLVITHYCGKKEVNMKILARLLLILAVAATITEITCAAGGEIPGEQKQVIRILNDTDIVMVHNLYWMNPVIDGERFDPIRIAVAELKPGKHQELIRDMGKTKLFIISWFPARTIENRRLSKEKLAEYEVIMKVIIPRNTDKVVILHKTYKVSEPKHPL